MKFINKKLFDTIIKNNGYLMSLNKYRNCQAKTIAVAMVAGGILESKIDYSYHIGEKDWQSAMLERNSILTKRDDDDEFPRLWQILKAFRIGYNGGAGEDYAQASWGKKDYSSPSVTDVYLNHQMMVSHYKKYGLEY